MSEIKTNKISPRKGTTQTIGDSGDTVTISSGATLSNAGTISTAGISGGTINNTTGTISGLQQVINWDTTAKTANFNAAVQSGYFVNTTSGAITVTFPASPVAGDVIAIKDYALTSDTNNITINPNGNNINGSSSNYIINTEGSAAQFIYVDATRGWVLTDASKASDITEDIRYVTATGGTITTCGDYKIHTFTGPGTFCVTCEGTSAGSNKVDYLVIAGGGSGGVGSSDLGGSGGGAGGYRESYCSTTSGCYTASPLATCASLPVSVTGYPITVGAGGTSSSGNSYPGVSNGSDSIFSTITSAGGGNGSNFYMDQGRIAGGAGGSGGGKGYGGQGGAGNTPPVSPPQGNNGGTWIYATKVGGGGGAGAIGGSGTGPCGGGGSSGGGGAGVATAITGSSVTRAGGGGGAGGGYPYYNVSAGSGGPGGGGAGGSGGGGAGTAATANTGSGGGGRGSTAVYSNPGNLGGATGGSGIVIIRYKYQN